MAVSLPTAHRPRVSIRRAGLVAALVSVGFGSTGRPGTRQRGDVTTELHALYQRVLDAVRRRDTSALAPLLADGYLFTDGTTGALITKRDRLQAVAQSTESIEALRLDSLSARLYPDAAVASALVRQVEARDGQHTTQVIRATVVFVRTRGRGWQVAATHTSVGHEPSPD